MLRTWGAALALSAALAASGQTLLPDPLGYSVATPRPINPAEGTTNPFLRERCRMNRIMQKPGAVVVPQVMVRVFRADADSREGGDSAHDA